MVNQSSKTNINNHHHFSKKSPEGTETASYNHSDSGTSPVTELICNENGFRFI
jgi:hypothetical protein